MTCARLEVLVFAVILLAGCTSIETHRPRALKGLEKTAALDEAAVQYEKTEKRYESPNQFHLAVIKPDYFKLEYAGYLVGIEKVNFRRVGVPAYGNCAVGAAYCLNTGSAYFADKPDVRSEIEVRLEGPWWAKNLGFAKTQIVSHIVRFENKPDGAPSRWRGCLIYNTYGPINGTECDPGDKLWVRPRTARLSICI